MLSCAKFRRFLLNFHFYQICSINLHANVDVIFRTACLLPSPLFTGSPAVCVSMSRCRLIATSSVTLSVVGKETLLDNALHLSGISAMLLESLQGIKFARWPIRLKFTPRIWRWQTNHSIGFRIRLFDWSVSIEFAKENSKLIGHVTNLVPCMDF